MSSPFTKNLLTLFTGNIIAFIIPIILYPFLSRVFKPDDYALFGLYFSVFSLLEIASAGRYDLAVIMPEKDDDAINIVAGGLLIALAYSLCILIVVFVVKDEVANRLNNPHLANWLFLLPFGLFLISISKLCNSWLIRVKKFKAVSINKASQKIAEGSTQLIFGIVLKAGNGLIIGELGGRIFNAFVSLYQSVNLGLERRNVLKDSIKNNLKRYSDFPKFNILPSVLNALGGLLPVFIISSYYSVDVSGSFNFSRIILSIPFALIASGISQVLTQQVSEKKHKNESLSSDVLSLTIKLSALSAVGIIVLYLTGPELFEVVFGSKWRLSGEFTSILIFSYAVSFIISPFSILLVVLGRIRWVGFWQTFYFFAVSILWFLHDLPIENFLITLVFIDIVAYTIYGFLIYKTIRNYENKLSHPLL